MSEQPEVFDALAVHMVRVGENSGNLDQVLAQLAEFKERWLELRDRVINALLYPSIVLLVSVIVTVFLMTVVVPMLFSVRFAPYRYCKTLRPTVSSICGTMQILGAMVIPITTRLIHVGRGSSSR